MNVCTITTRNQMARARVLAASLAEHHPDSRLTVLLLDDVNREFNPAGAPFDVVRPGELDLPNFEHMAVYYDAFELATALKPWVLRHVLERDDHAVFLDNDIRLYRACPEVSETAAKCSVVLTPHLLEPLPNDGRRPSERDILQAGTFNSGCVSVSDTGEGRRFLGWWSDRLLEECRINLAAGQFLDQRILDLVPGMFDGVAILRDPTLNVGYWNIPQRPIERSGDGTLHIAGAPLGFMHFSGFDPLRPEILSAHQDRIRHGDQPILDGLAEDYARELLDSGWEHDAEIPYAFGRTASGRTLDPSSRHLDQRTTSIDALSGTPFDIDGEQAFDAWAAGPGDMEPRITRYMEQLHRDRVDLQAAFGPLDSLDVTTYVAWANTDGASQFEEVKHLIAPMPDSPATRAPKKTFKTRSNISQSLKPAVVVDGVSKTFSIPHEQMHTFKERALHPFRKTTSNELRALRNVSFAVPSGSFYGIVGRNGSGKSTMLKSLAGIYRVDTGAIYVNGQMSTFIELGVGFNPDLAALDNVVLNGAMMGLSRKETRKRFDSIIDFAELGDFLDLKIKNYSSGMLVRLAFSVMIHVDADIMLIDEVLAVGDAAFQQKCYDEFDRIRASDSTVLFVTHDMDAVNRFCDQALLLERGKIAEIGEVERVADRYMELNFSEEARHEYDEPSEAEASA